jgi:hypothetical protein
LPSKIGRPKAENPKSKKVTVNFTENEMNDFNDYVEENETTKTKVIRDFVKSLIGQKK